MSEITLIKCDVCESSKDIRKQKPMQMLRHFDCTDGRSFYKHLVDERIDICGECLESVMISGKYLIDNRVQGYGDIELQKADD